jgi:tetratricopeptide (TPR) repeat protein
MDKIRPNKKIVLSVLGVLVVLVVATGAGIGLRLVQNDNANDEAAAPFSGEPLPEKVGEAQDLRLQGDVEGSMKKIDEALADNSVPNDEKYQLYIQQGNTYYDKKDLSAAINAYVTAESLKKTYEITALLAEMYEEAGNNAKAVEYYKKSIPLIPDTPMKAEYKADAEQKIKKLEG